MFQNASKDFEYEESVDALSTYLKKLQKTQINCGHITDRLSIIDNLSM